MNKKAILITGTSSGIGLETAVFLAERGFKVYATMRDLSRSGKLDAEAMRRNVRMEVLQLDITDPESISRTCGKIIDQCGGVYGLVNNAGIVLRGYFEDQSEEEIREVFAANVFGTMSMIREVLPHMRTAKQGRIMIISSIGGRIGSLAVSTYCATKFAQEGFGESLSQEVAPFGIYVSIVEPAIIRTKQWGSNRGISRKSLNPDSTYYAWFREAERLADRLVDTSPTKPVDVAIAVYKALTVRRPKLRYIVGWRADLVMCLRRYLPDEFFERIYFGKVVRRVTRSTAN